MRSPFRAHATLVACALFSCAALAVAGDVSLVGTWEHEAPGQPRLVVSFDAEGGGKMNETPLRYSTAGDRLTIVANGDSTAYSFKLDGDTLVIAGGDLDAPTTFARKKAKK